MSITQERRKELRELCEKLGRREWRIDPDDELCVQSYSENAGVGEEWSDVLDAYHDGIPQAIIDLRAAVPLLLDALEKSEQEIGNRKFVLNNIHDLFKEICGVEIEEHSDIRVALMALRINADDFYKVKSERDALQSENAYLTAENKRLKDRLKNSDGALELICAKYNADIKDRKKMELNETYLNQIRNGLKELPEFDELTKAVYEMPPHECGPGGIMGTAAIIIRKSAAELSALRSRVEALEKVREAGERLNAALEANSFEDWTETEQYEALRAALAGCPPVAKGE